MRQSQVLRTLAAVMAAGIIALPLSLNARRDAQDFAAGVAFTGADESPNPVVSNVNDYINQDEQINITPNDGTIKVLRTDQKVNVNDFVTAIIPCKNVNPREIRGPVRTMVRKEGGDADVLQDKESGEYYLHVVCPPFQLPYVREVVEGLDQKWVNEREDGSAELYYVGKFRNIRDVQRITQFYISPEGVGRFLFDDLNNGMYFTDQPALMGLQKKGLSEVDIPVSQVLLDVAVYEIDANNDTMLGFDWAQWLNGPGRHLFEFDYLYESNDSDQTNIPRDTMAGRQFDRTVSSMTFNAVGASQFFDYVQNKGYVRELVKTQVTARSGDPAIIEAVDAVAHFASEPRSDARHTETVADRQGDQIDVERTDNRGRLIHYREAGDKVGVRLSLIPYIGRQSMELDVNVDVSNVNGYTPGGDPILGVRSTENYVRLVDGQPFVLGGVERDTVVRRKNGMPFLHKLPVIGWLFGNETNAKRRTRILVVVTPTFDVMADSDLQMPQEMATIAAQARGDAELKVPSTPFGFDQWLMD